ncbi:MAG: SOS response-associated peptidase family protein [Ignavibacteriales bacterium]|nr:SOS response-associated peptidase family protein [Ignavibacteriales bacterium]
MCGRFESKNIEKMVENLFRELNLKVEVDEEISKRSQEDIRPTEKILSVILKEDIYRLTKVHWGIKFKEDSPLIFNSRIETIKEKTYWNKLLANNKCIVPMTGFYEWKTEGRKKIKYKMFLPDQPIFFVPAIYHKDKEEKIYASLITTVPNKFIAQIHHRMPVIFDLESAINYLNDDVEKNMERCLPYDDKKKMEMELAD